MALVRMSQTTARRFAGAMRLGDSRPHGFRGIAPLSPHPIRSEKLKLVKVAKDGGVGGGAAANCTWTYTVKTLSDVTMETAIAPAQARYPNTTYLEAAAGGRTAYALAQYVSGSLILVWVPGEIADTSTC